jgi:hypothetical protein
MFTECSLNVHIWWQEPALAEGPAAAAAAGPAESAMPSAAVSAEEQKEEVVVAEIEEVTKEAELASADLKTADDEVRRRRGKP